MFNSQVETIGISNIERRISNVEGIYFLKGGDSSYILYFEIRYSVFDIRYCFSLQQKKAPPQGRRLLLSNKSRLVFCPPPERRNGTGQ
jgi:hypothetical protein